MSLSLLSIFPVTLVLEESLENTRIQLEYEMELTVKHVRLATEKILASGLLKSSLWKESNEKGTVDENVVNYLRDISLYVQQRYQIVSNTHQELMETRKEILETILSYRRALKDIHSILIYKTAILSREILVSVVIILN